MGAARIAPHAHLQSPARRRRAVRGRRRSRPPAHPVRRADRQRQRRRRRHHPLAHAAARGQRRPRRRPGDRAGRPLRGLQSRDERHRGQPDPVQRRSGRRRRHARPGAHAGRHQPGRGQLHRDRRLHRGRHAAHRHPLGDERPRDDPPQHRRHERALGHPHRLQRRSADRGQRDVALGGRARHLRVQQRRSPGDPAQPRVGQLRQRHPHERRPEPGRRRHHLRRGREANIIYNNGRTGGSGINGDGVQSSRIDNNLLYDNHASGISLYQIDGGQPSRNNFVAHNTICRPPTGAGPSTSRTAAPATTW